MLEYLIRYQLFLKLEVPSSFNPYSSTNSLNDKHIILQLLYQSQSLLVMFHWKNLSIDVFVVNIQL